MPLSHLHHAHLAPPELRVRARPEVFQPMDLLPEAQIDRVAAMRAVPSLIKSYLRLGGFVGEGAFVDHVFNTTDICLVLDTARLSERDLLRFSSSAG
jgi:putative hemolysin